MSKGNTHYYYVCATMTTSVIYLFIRFLLEYLYCQESYRLPIKQNLLFCVRIDFYLQAFKYIH